MANKRYYNKLTKTEVFKSGKNCVSLDASNPFFSQLPTGKRLTYDTKGIPNGLEDIPVIPLTKDQKIKNIKRQRDIDRSQLTIKYESKSWSFSKENMIDFGIKIARNRDFIWKSDNGSHVTLTPSQAEDIARKLDDISTKIFFDAETEIGNL